MLVAADTFRAAATEQLSNWAERVEVELVKQSSGADPAAVVYDAMAAARARGVDVMLIDTAGRLHTKVNLMEELKKVKRVISRQMDTAPHEVLLILDSTTGQNALSQTRLFHQELTVTGLVLTKLDGTAKGGIVVGACQEFQIPIRFIGLGEGLDDLREFDPEQFVAALF
jgi:fused signal recognition particle receptor